MVNEIRGGSLALKRASRSCGALLLCGIVALVMVYHFVVPLGAVLYTNGNEGNDSGQMVWNLWAANEAITSGHNPYETRLIYYPQGANLSHHTFSPGFFPVTFLVRFVSRGDQRYPIYAVRVVTLLCFSLILFFSYLVLRELGFLTLISLTVAVAYTFGDFYLKHALHLNHLAGFFIPLSCLFAVRAFKRPASMNLIAFAAATGLAVYFTEFALLIYLAAAIFILCLLAFSNERRQLFEVWKRVSRQQAALSVIVFALIVGPFLKNVLTDKVLKPSLAESSLYSANAAAFFVPGPQHSLMSTIFAPVQRKITQGAGVFEEFIGFTLIVFGIAGLIQARGKLIWCAGLTSFIFYLFSLGPTLKVFGVDTGALLPYRLLMEIPPFDIGRTPVRFVSVATFMLMFPAADGLQWCHQRVTKLSGRTANVIVLAVFLLTLAQVYSPIARQNVFMPPRDLQQRVSGPVFNIPLRALDGYAALLQVFHHQPIATGFIARETAARRQRLEQLQEIYARGGSEFCDRIAELGFQSIIVTRGDVLVPFHLSTCKLPVIDLRSEVQWVHDTTARIEQEEPSFRAYDFGKQITFSSPDAAGYLWYGWSGPESEGRWTDRGAAAISFSLSQVEAGILRLKLAPFVFPPRLVKQAVGVQVNGRQLTTLMLQQPQRLDYSFDLPADLLHKQNVIVFDLPDARSPKSLGMSEDGRLLGISISSLEIDIKNH